MPARTRIILLSIAALITIVFLQPLLTLLGGLMVLALVGTLIFRDLPLDTQDAIEEYVNAWLQRARDGFWPSSQSRHDDDPVLMVEEEYEEKPAPKPRARRSRARSKSTSGSSTTS
ncbi:MULTISPECIES: hypothetical protein [Ectothiorhodospira]|nr:MULTISPECIES: hypothetical protein [Ectothiorhodospira]MCG5494900.1 hypothetical protein [Ectothiorhodospira variabilis]MCG5497695.1 hypothetical protein [Ectothiorhodospira variabilis]MCG5504413.1 hypothetical protein [Ectothiorhodospira variabilis]MCG5507568.1 hypothetical protein [Ectothiorhodospira variabilis]MCG5525182.1 hypothetical protein [Ectothiorhodospira haloalkaliphila]